MLQPDIIFIDEAVTFASLKFKAHLNLLKIAFYATIYIKQPKINYAKSKVIRVCVF